MQVYRRLQNSDVFIQGEGAFPQTGMAFAANGADNVICTVSGDEIFDEAWADIQQEGGAAAGATQAEVLTYLDEQLEPVKVSGTWSNTDITTNLNNSGSYLDTYAPIVSNEVKESDLFTRINDEVFECNFFGEILIAVNVHFTSAGQRAALQSRMIRDPLGTPSAEGPVCSTGYIRNTNGHAESSLNYTRMAGVSVGTQFAVGLRRESTVTADVTLAATGTSQISIARLR